MSALFGDGIGFFSNNGGSGSSGGAGSFSTLTVNTPSVAGGEVVSTFGVTGDAVGKLQLKNGGAAAIFIPWIFGAGNDTNTALLFTGSGVTDTGGAPLVAFSGAIGAGSVSVRPLFDFQNNGSSRLTIGANGSTTQTGPSAINMTAIAGSETLQTWSVSDDAVASLRLRNATSANNTFIPWLYATGSAANIALAVAANATTDTGTNPVCQFSSSIGAGAVAVRPAFDFQNNGVSQLSIAGNGTVTQANGQVVKVRTGLTTPIAVALTDYIVGSNLTTPGPVSVVLPAAAGNAGRIFTIKDEKGDAATNNITVTVTGGGNINGAASFVISNAYGGANVYSNGTQWFTH